MEDKKTVPPYKDTECKECKTKEESLFARSPMGDAKDFFCKSCIDSGKHSI